jgi:hypothetical protein
MVSFHGSSTPNGTFRRTEKVKDAGGDSAFHLTGHLDFFAPGSDPGVAIYSGTLTTIGKWPAQ